jgi:hypothetical protein
VLGDLFPHFGVVEIFRSAEPIDAAKTLYGPVALPSAHFVQSAKWFGAVAHPPTLHAISRSILARSE